ncbi:hypothetical protein HPP92_024808 [Vanilla planifolia]|uniref:Uncharacterized protein n=1 Tax=Vanilla planifolia TaxID=51239 RepID=A0A835UDL9_VANPL|nr:hypothetical protein HPP92_024808 [Vanilla planifolia]
MIGRFGPFSSHAYCSTTFRSRAGEILPYICLHCLSLSCHPSISLSLVGDEFVVADEVALSMEAKTYVEHPT